MDQISIFIGSEENVDDIVEFLNEHFLPHEPMNMSIDLVPAGYRIPFFDDMVKKQIAKKENLVVMARDGQQLLGLVMFVTKSKDGNLMSGSGKFELIRSLVTIFMLNQLPNFKLILRVNNLLFCQPFHFKFL